MAGLAAQRVQWVTRRAEMSRLVERMVRAGAELVARSGFEPATEDLDDVADAETGALSIAEFRMWPLTATRQLVKSAARVAAGETMIVDLRRPRPRVQLLPVTAEHGLIVRHPHGVRRLPRRSMGQGRRDRRWLIDQLAMRGAA